ncbi:polysaccharide deacetylase [Methylobacterium sp. 77]|uniref:polysaccharide deacetylase n=1 Tax=Methylobacterium sp. 77 TaxID=1101192 RepID=UPI0012DC49FF|nr:polysaccharide deacetylase [Methylobacterium sp. 77]
MLATNDRCADPAKRRLARGQGSIVAPVRRVLSAGTILLALLAGAPVRAQMPPAETVRDAITGLPRQPVHVTAWPGGKKVAVTFVLYVEVWGTGHGPNFRTDMNGRDPDVVDEAFRTYAIDWGVTRVGRLFREQGVPLTIALNAQFPSAHPDIWRRLRESVPSAPILGHGLNNSTQLLPLGQGLAAQQAYIRRTLDLLEKETGRRPIGWSSPSVFPNGDTFPATAAEGIRYTLDSMDSDILSRLRTPSGPLLQIPYPAVTVDMGQYLSRGKEPADLERLWIDYVGELAREATADTAREATVVAIGIHPFVVGTPSGAAAMRRVLEALKALDPVWLTDTQAVFEASGR